MPPNRVDRFPLSLLSSPAMDRLHVLGATPAAIGGGCGVARCRSAPWSRSAPPPRLATGSGGMTSIRSRGPSSDSGRRGTPESSSPFNLTGWRGFLRMGASNRHGWSGDRRSRRRRVAGRDAARNGTPRGPTWWSCASTWLDRPDADAALAGRSRPVDRHLPRRLGRRPVPGQRSRAPGDPDPGAGAGRRLRRPRVEGAPRRARALAGRRREPASCCRATTSTASRPTWPTACATCAGYGTGVVKVAVTARTLRRRCCRSSPSAGPAATPAQRTVVIAMGTPGIATRVLPEHVGSCWTYGGNGVAPGQVTVDRLRDEFRVGARRRVDAGLRRRRPARSAIRCRRPCTTPRSPRPASTASTCRARRPTSTTSSPSPTCLGIAGASVTAPLQGGRARASGGAGAAR